MPALLTRAERLARSVAVWDPYHDTAHAALLSGSGRSGTTWLLEAYSRAGELRPVFEPFRPDLDARFSDLRPGRYVPVDAARLPSQEAVEDVLTGRYRHPWADQEASLNPLKRYRGRLIKEIRFPMWAGWVAHRHPDVRIVHVIRHPLATLASQSVLGWSPERMHYMMAQPELVDGLLGDLPLRELAVVDDATALVTRWAVENVTAARTYGADRSALVSYDVAVEDRRELGLGAERLGIAPDRLTDLDKPSKMTHAKSSNAHATKDPRGWMRRIDDSQKAVVARVLDAVGLEEAFPTDGTVDRGALQRWWDACGRP
ncbi:hypothetical protein RN607_11860 [Demequina capsici]|uniref:Sulfotransferase family protein n=1 Tax=Demequina capsici TaxID=3075620 RepID=A0AA96FBW4_9MICO|nr:hypothetical protein [Demequina sp. PMTSA13]WNM26888.1 hypothetical protein RN607_11860 [Demequina sp. PMTSA13]